MEKSLGSRTVSPPSDSNHDSAPIINNPPRWLVAAAWVGSFLPAFYILWVILENRPTVPYHDSWAFSWQYYDWSL